MEETMTELFNHKKKVLVLRDKCAALSGECGRDTEQFIRDTSEVLSRSTPCLMFYGLYNAGKSSIINALTGEETAAVGDVPTTTQVQNINWNGFLIVDTPGLNAQTEHTLTADSQIDKSDVVVFVTDDMNVDEKSFYYAFINVLKKNKPTLIVINQKNADGPVEQSPNISILREQIVANIRYAANEEGLTDVEHNKCFRGIIPVNAMTAWVARNFPESAARHMRAESNIDELLKQMQSVLNASNGVRMLIPALDIIDSALNGLSADMKSGIKSDIQKAYYSTRDNILRQKDSLYKRLLTEGRTKINAFADKAAASISTGDTVDVAEIRNSLEQTIRQAFSDANVSLQGEFQLCSVDLGELSVKLDKSDFKLDLPEPDDCNDDGLLGWIEKITDITLPGGLTLPDNTDGGIVPTLFPITPAPEKTGFLVLLGLIKSLVNSKKKAEEQKQRESEMRRQVEEMNRRSEERINSMVTQIVEINRRIRTAASDLESSYSANVSKLVDNAFAPVLDSLEKEFGEEEKRSDTAKIHLDQINSLLHECSAIRASIDG